MPLSLTFLGRTCDRWRVRVEAGACRELAGLTVSLVTESGRALGPSVVAPEGAGPCWIAELRGPPQLPPGTVVRAVAEVDGSVIAKEVGVDPRRGLHAFLHADARLPVETEVKGAALTAREANRLGKVFPWVCGCGPPAGADAGGDDLDAMLREFDIDPADLDEALLGALRK